MLGQIYDAFCEMQKKKEAKCGKLPCFASSKGCDDRLHGVDVKINGYISASAVGQYAIAGGP